MTISLPKLSLILLVLLWMLQMVASNQLATKGAQIGALRQEIDQVEKENQLLVEHLADTSSLEQIAERATLLGLVRPDTVLSVTLPPPLAMNQ